MARCCLPSRKANCLRRCTRTSCLCSSYFPKHPNPIERILYNQKTLSMQQNYLLFIRLTYLILKNHDLYYCLRTYRYKLSIHVWYTSLCQDISWIVKWDKRFNNQVWILPTNIQKCIFLFINEKLFINICFYYSIHFHIEIEMMK